jgi:hypothetical protein
MLATVNLTSSNINSIKNGDTVNVSGTVKVAANQVSALSRAKSIIGRSGATLDFTGGSSQVVKINGKSGGKIQGITFKNGAVEVNNSSNYSISSSNFQGYAGKNAGVFAAGKRALVQVSNSNGASVSNLRINADNTSRNLRGVKIFRSSNVTVSGVTATGRLQAGIEYNGGSGGTIRNNNLTRASGTPGAGNGGNAALGEDHGIYVLGGNNGAKVTNNTTRGWSTRPSGHGLKLKDVQNVTATGNRFASGIIGRVGSLRLFRNVTIGSGQGTVNVDGASTAAAGNTGSWPGKR